ILPYQLVLAGLAVAPVFPPRLLFPVVAVFSFDSFSDLVEAVLSFLSGVFLAVSFFLAGVVSARYFFFLLVAFWFGEAFFFSVVFVFVSFFFAVFVLVVCFFFWCVALVFGGAFFLGLCLGKGFGEGYGTVFGDGFGSGVEAAGFWIWLFAGAEAGCFSSDGGT